ncbi:MAG: UxaA family hydrolase, partial [Anaerolineae bacterium]
MEPERTTPSGAQPLREVAVHLHADDHVAIAKTNLTAGTTLVVDAPSKADSPSGAFRLGTTPVSDPGELITVRQFVPSGHKVAVRELAAGQPVRRYGQVIGLANRPIKPGEHVHTHNLSAEDFARRPEFGVDVQRVSYVPEPDRRTFLGYKRSDGRVGTRNYLAVISTVNCSAHASREIARHFTSERMATYPNVDGVMALTHPLGCPIHYELLRRTLVGMARHPNIAACILVGLGCETTQVADLMRSHGLLIQDLGGIAQTVRSGIAAIKDLLPTANAVQRTSQPISELTLALQCGGSDAWSGVSANPLVGLLADEIVRQGGTVV